MENKKLHMPGPFDRIRIVRSAEGGLSRVYDSPISDVRKNTYPRMSSEVRQAIHARARLADAN